MNDSRTTRPNRPDSPSYSRLSNFMGLFTDEEVAEWVKVGHPPDWVVLACTFFMDRAQLMERLAKDD